MPHLELETGLNIYYEVVGEGPPVLLIPQSSLGSDIWHPHPADDLANEFQVITFDPRGIGRSAARDEFLTLEQVAADCAALLRELEVGPAHVLGHSIGGGTALSLALTYPRLVSSLCLAASVAGAAIRSGEAVLPLPTPRSIIPLVEVGLEAHFHHQIFDTDSMFTEEFRVDHPDVVAEFYAKAWPTHADLNWHLRHQMARMTFEGTHRLQDVSVPSLILVGSQDLSGERPKLPSSQVLAERIPGAELRILEGLSHGMFWQDPRLVNKVLAEWFHAH